MWEGVEAESLLLLHGGDSILLLPKTVEEMKTRGKARENPKWITVAEFPGVGHAPMLMSPNQVSVIADFLFA